MLSAKERIIVALDVHTLEDLKRKMDAFAGEATFFKVGLEALIALGTPQVIQTVRQSGAELFLDAKFNDIPNTVAAAARAAAAFKVKMFDVHACSGPAALKAAAAEKGQSLLIAVTVLTSMDEETTQHVFGKSSLNAVLQFARDASAAGADGIVCSPQELEMLRKESDLVRLIKVVPGVRPAWASPGDQKRVSTPAQAIARGASYLVIGRPLTSPPPSVGSSKEAFKRIVEEVQEGSQ